jgi:osmotically inducible protein OsmC
MAGDSGAFEQLPFSLPSRIERVDGLTSPEELLAAAHGGCFTLSLAGELARAGTPAERLDVQATVVMDEVEERRHRVVSVHLSVRGRAPGADEGAFVRAAEAADAGCPFSALVKATAKVTFEAALAAG